MLRTPTGWQAKVQPTREQLEQSVRHKHANNLLHLLREEEIPVAKALGRILRTASVLPNIFTCRHDA